MIPSPTLRPKASEIELSVFGPGYGESIVVHLGNGQWIIIDSCVCDSTDYPTPLKYLKNLGVNIETDVVLVIASHWHDDHIKGLSKIVEECNAASFVCSSAMLTENFVMLAELFNKSEIKKESGVHEFSKVFSLLEAKKSPPKRAGINRRLLNLPKSSTSLPYDLSLHALSPTDKAVEDCTKQLAAYISKCKMHRRVPSPKPNNIAVVLQLIAGDDSILLGSDLENTPSHGWGIIVADTAKPSDRSLVFKVAHHGSGSGHHDDVWTKMLLEEPYAFLTPFKNGKLQIPTEDDIDRIKELTDKAYITRNPKLSMRKHNYAPDVKRTLKEAGIEMAPVLKSKGHVRFRFIPGTPASRTIELFNGAEKL